MGPLWKDQAQFEDISEEARIAAILFADEHDIHMEFYQIVHRTWGN